MLFRSDPPRIMKLILGPENLQTEFEFILYKVSGNLMFSSNKILSKKYYNIGLYLSGGLDSAALLCLILAELREIGKLDSVPITCFTVNKNDGLTFYSNQVIKRIEEKYDVSIEHINNIANDDNQSSLGNIGPTAIKFVTTYHSGMVVYMAHNRMAPDNIRPFNQRLLIDYGMSTSNSWYLSPFLFLHKPQILDIFYKLDCDEIIPYTHSCNVLKEGACGECYSCAERKWGFDSLGKTDPGTIIV